MSDDSTGTNGPQLPPPTHPGASITPPAVPAVAWWKRRWWKLPVWAWIVIGVVIIGGAASAGGTDDEAADATDTTQALADTAAEPDTTSAPDATELAADPTTTSSTTSSTTSTTTSTTTTAPPTVPADIVEAFTTAGLTAPTYDEYTAIDERCGELRSAESARDDFWSDQHTDDERAAELATFEIVCPAVTMILQDAKPLPIIEDGVYLVPDEVQPGIYRVGSYWAMLDENQEIIDNEITSDCLTIMVLTDEATFVEISGQALLVEHLPVYNPIENECTDGTFLVGPDIVPGRYRVLPDGGSAYWARLDSSLEIIDNNISDGQLIVDIREGDFAVNISGTLEPMD